MNETRLCTIEQIEQFLSASAPIEFSAAADDGARYEHISRVLKRFDYPRRNKRERGVLLKYLRHTSGYSRAQVTRLVTQWQRNRLAEVPLAKRYRAPAAPFARKYLAIDIELLVEMDKANEDVCGPAIAHLLQRAYQDYSDMRYERLATLSVSHLYNLRKSAGYLARRKNFTKTRPVCNVIGVRKAPSPEGRAGFVRIDTVHQGDLDGIKGVYHITCVDAVSQWQVEACVQGISEAYLLPVLALIMAQFPFVILGFHSDNGSEYINHQVAKLLELMGLSSVAETTKATLRQQFTALDPVRLLQEIRAAQNTLAGIAQTGNHEHAPPAPVTDVATFLSGLSKAWKDGEVRPTHRKQPGATHWWRSRADPFEHAWPIVEQWLETESTVTASEMMERLAVMVPDAYASKAQLRTLQRRVKQWRAEKVRDLILGKLRQSAGDGEGAASAAPSPFNQRQKATQ